MQLKKKSLNFFLKKLAGDKLFIGVSKTGSVRFLTKKLTKIKF